MRLASYGQHHTFDGLNDWKAIDTGPVVAVEFMAALMILFV